MINVGHIINIQGKHEAGKVLFYELVTPGSGDPEGAYGVPHAAASVHTQSSGHGSAPRAASRATMASSLRANVGADTLTKFQADPPLG